MRDTRKSFVGLEPLEVRRVLSGLNPAGEALLPEGWVYSQKPVEPTEPMPNLALEMVGAWHCDFVADGKDLVCVSLMIKEVAGDGTLVGVVRLNGLGFEDKAFEIEGNAGPQGRFTLTWVEGKNAYGSLAGAYHAGYEGLQAEIAITADTRTVVEQLSLSRGEHESALPADAALPQAPNGISPFARKVMIDDGAGRVVAEVDLKI